MCIVCSYIWLYIGVGQCQCCMVSFYLDIFGRVVKMFFQMFFRCFWQILIQTCEIWCRDWVVRMVSKYIVLWFFDGGCCLRTAVAAVRNRCITLPASVRPKTENNCKVPRQYEITCFFHTHFLGIFLSIKFYLLYRNNFSICLYRLFLIYMFFII